MACLAMACAFVLAACASTPADTPLPAVGGGGVSQGEDVLDVTMYQLIATPERYDGKTISVIGLGYFELAFGNENRWALYATRDDQDHSTCALVDIELPDALTPEAPKLRALMGKYVLAIGTFEAAQPIPPGVVVMKTCPGASTLHARYIGHWEF